MTEETDARTERRAHILQAADALGISSEETLRRFGKAVDLLETGKTADEAVDDGQGARPGAKSPDPSVDRAAAAIDHARMVYDEYAGRRVNFPDCTGVMTMELLAEILNELRGLRALVKERL